MLCEMARLVRGAGIVGCRGCSPGAGWRRSGEAAARQQQQQQQRRRHAATGPTRTVAAGRQQEGALSSASIISEPQAEPALFKDRLTPGGNWVGNQEVEVFQTPPSGIPGMRPSGTLPAPHVIGAAASGKVHPTAEPISEPELERLVEFIRDSTNLLVITGAGCSTESEIPDYRSPAGAYSSGYKPMTHQQFMANDANRSRYWQRSSAGYEEFAAARCNEAHFALQRLEAMGWVKHIITQNVDRLHHKAGSNNVLELHGTTHRVICTSCETLMERRTLQDMFEELNGDIMAPPSLSAAESNADPALEGPAVKRPDGDTDAQLSQAFRVPACSKCGGVLKPDVVFFGANVPKERADEALRLAEEADAILVVGSSLMVFSVFRLIKASRERGGKLAILTVGPTRADELTSLKFEHLAGETLVRAARHPTLSVPPGR